ncbi:hypothetical protein L0F51_00040 [Afifella sp. H1R]|uniref:hypothetical protein n=1 Tax=Afifella sp. H1R TaxID=2908841 RepID=UPI001F24BC5D|nr:hypothetical protein [Afifella sp. H1R]MCF1502155.1 hypothetical protein [Afifella sp. H1R]
MNVRPILFGGPMVHEILERRKTQTRRVLKPQFEGMHLDRLGPTGWQWTGEGGLPHIPVRVPYAVGDLLWVRETWRAGRGYDGAKIKDIAPWSRLWFDAGDCNDNAGVIGRKSRPSIHMPRWASRITLRVIDVRVERLQGISEEDAVAEGVRETDFYDNAERKVAAGAPYSIERLAFADLWQSINVKRPGCTWEDNPWVAVVSFDPLFANVDEIVAREVA